MTEEIFAWLEVGDMYAVFIALHADDVFTPFESNPSWVDCDNVNRVLVMRMEGARRTLILVDL